MTLGATIELTGLDIGVVMGISDRVVVLDYGRKIADGPPDEIGISPEVLAAYLGVAHGDFPHPTPGTPALAGGGLRALPASGEREGPVASALGG
jgi:Branched-chain amino acid ATP-binding cassette transporter